MIVDPVAVERRIEQRMLELRIDRDAKRALEAQERGPIIEPEIVTLRERLARPRAEARYRIDRWQPLASRVMLAAQFKAGKTTLVGNYLRCLADGDDWLGQDLVSATSGVIVHVDTEMSETMNDDWLGSQRIRRDDKILTIPLRGRLASFDLLNPDRLAQWAKRFKVLGAEVIVLDCLRPVLDSLGLDEHKDAGKFLVAFDALLRDAEIPDALLVQHMGHLNERARGDSRLRDWPEVEWRLVRQDDQPGSPRFLSAYGRDVDVPEGQLTYDPLTRRLTLLGGSRQDARTTAALDAVVEILETEPDLTGRKIKIALADSEHPKHVIEDALKLGSGTRRLTVTPGPRGAKLYRSVPVSRSVPPVSQGHTARQAFECPSPFIEKGHSQRAAGDRENEQNPTNGRDTHSDRRPSRGRV